MTRHQLNQLDLQRLGLNRLSPLSDRQPYSRLPHAPPRDDPSPHPVQSDRHATPVDLYIGSGR